MQIDYLQLFNFRNYERLAVNFNSGINILYGDNAQGKTNILESIFVAATTKSHRGSKDRELIKIKEDEAHIRIGIKKAGVGHKIDMHLKRSGSKGAAVDGIKLKKSSELYGLLHVIAFSPEDLSMIKNGPVERRRFIDMELCQLDKVYIRDLSAYNKVLFQRNNLIKQIPFNSSLEDTIDIWNRQLITYGSKIIYERKKFIDDLSEIIREKHYQLTSGKEELKIQYKPNVELDAFENQLISNIKRDINLKTTTTGPHRDDICFYVNGEDVRIYGSQGQQRSVSLSLKLAEIELVKRKINDTPVLLLDDVLSELDRNRQTKLLDEINDIQTFITCTGLEEFVEKRKISNSIFHIVNGGILWN
jgi:DNA replication and repair protein RecF